MTRQSMTGFARLDGQAGPANWQWEVRSVNGRGFDLRMRLPEGLDVLEKQIRSVAATHLTRGNINLTLRLNPGETTSNAVINEAALTQALGAIRKVEQAAIKNSVTLAPVNAIDLMSRPNVLESNDSKGLGPDLISRISADIEPLFAAFRDARMAEGAMIKDLLSDQIGQIETLIKQAQTSAEARAAKDGVLLIQKVKTLLKVTELADESRLQQELALIAAKADVTEEIDRLNAHVEAAKALLADPNAVGRKFDFLMQEFNREANTLCAKSGSTEMTAIGLDLKTVIDQMREQVQNLE